MKHIGIGDILMIIMIPILYAMQEISMKSLGIVLFSIYHIIALSGVYGAWIAINVFSFLQHRNAVKKGLVKALEDINKIGDKDWRDKPRWIK